MPAPESTIGAPMQSAGRRRWRGDGLLRGLVIDLGYIGAGFPLAVVSLPLLVSFTSVSVALILVWVGVILLPLTLLLASAFARLSRARLLKREEQLRGSGKRISLHRPPNPTARYRTRGSGLSGLIKIMGDPRRWLDLTFEALIALPLRTVSFVVTLACLLAGLGEVTGWIWWRFLPEDSSPQWPLDTLTNIAPGLVPQSASGQTILAYVLSFCFGLVVLRVVPLLARSFAALDAMIARALLFDSDAVRENYPNELATASAGKGNEETMTTAPVGAQSAVRNSALPREISTNAVPGRRGEVSAWVWASVGIVSLILLAVAWPLLAALYQLHAAVAMVIAIAHSAACLLAVRRPKLAIIVAGAASLLTVILTANLATVVPWPWPVPVLLAQCLLVLVIALKHTWQLTVGMLSVQVIVTAFAFATLMPPFHPSAANAVVTVSVTAGLAVLGLVLQTSARDLVRAEAAEKLSEAEIQRRKDLQERNRIARELHDVVAHSMSVINVQATTATYRKPGMDPAIEQEFTDIAASSRQALGEMRSLLAILRGGDDAPTMPVRNVADIEELVDSARTSGVPITAAITAEVPAAISPTVYRIVQEGLSNALRHAPGAEISIRVETAAAGGGAVGVDGAASGGGAVVGGSDSAVLGNDSIRVTVENTAPHGQARGAEGAGLGLVGLRERVTTLGGTLTSEKTEAGGFRLKALLPTLDRAE